MADIADPLPIPARLRASLRSLLRGENAPWPSGADEQDAAKLLAAIDQHGLGPLAYARLAEGGDVWPVTGTLREIAIRASAVETWRLADLRTLLDAFAARGIDVLILKGTALAYDVYESPELRPRGDTDLLIAERDCEPVRRLMRELGYETQLTSGDTLVVRQQSFRRNGIVYDIHWDVTNSPVVRDAMPFDELFARAISVPRISPHARGLSHPDALLLACLHRVAHHHDNERLIWLYDVHLLRERMGLEEHEAFWRRAAEKRCVAIAERTIALTDEWFAGVSHDRAADWLSVEERERDEPSAALLDRSRTRAALLGGEFEALNWPSRFRRLRELAFPPASFMRQSFASAPRALLPALYVWRGLRGVMRLFQRVVR